MTQKPGAGSRGRPATSVAMRAWDIGKRPPPVPASAPGELDR
ncbi:hypothetical protein [Streptomyces sp. NPDC101115]